MRLLICGDRHWTNQQRVDEVLHLMHGKDFVDVVIEGEAPGADTCGKIAAQKLNIPVIPFPADWKKFGRAAGPIRNSKMLTDGNPDIVLAFHNDILKSKGTKNMCEIAKKAGKIVYIAREFGPTERY